MKYKSSNVGPRSAMHGIRHRLVFHTKSFRQAADAALTRAVLGATEEHDVFGQLGIVMRFPVNASSLLNHVSGVVRTRAEKQMMWVYALPVVAFVKNVYTTVTNRPVMKFIAKSMGPERTSPALAWAQLPVTVTCLGAGPVPAVMRLAFVYKGPEPVCYRSAFRASRGALSRAVPADASMAHPGHFGFSSLEIDSTDGARESDSLLHPFCVTSERAHDAGPIFESGVEYGKRFCANLANAIRSRRGPHRKAAFRFSPALNCMDASFHKQVTGVICA